MSKTTTNKETATIKDQVLAELRSQKVKLWLPPYYNNNRPDPIALQKLANELLSRMENMDGSKEDIVAALEALQSHALEKLFEKKKKKMSRLERLEIKVLGLRSDMDAERMQIPSESWAERVEIAPKAFKLHSVNPSLTVGKILEDLKTLLKVDTIRLVHKGKSISAQQNDDALLCDLILQGGSSPQQSISMLCLVSYMENAANPSPDRTLIASLRRAAEKLQGGANFEVTDQHGKLVPMLPTERHAFLTALGLHRLGRKRMDDEDCSAALVFLLEADHEWNNVSSEWRDKVDNYGLLQLDIAWVYLKLQSLESLPDVTRRLEVAETALRKQVHTNFVTLALVQADMGNAVPPLAAVFCRLFLLQGVAFQYSQKTKESKERLDWAWSLCQSLRSVSSDDNVSSLCGVLGVTQFEAISALRRTNGNLDQAAELIEKDDSDAILQSQRREQQRRLGLCKNTADYVDLDLVPKLQSVLGLSAPTPQQGAVAQEMDPNFAVAAGLLRLANNDLGTAIDLYQEMERSSSAVLRRVSVLDRSLQEQGLVQKKRARYDENDQSVDEDNEPVDDVSLVTLVSMGVDEQTAKDALRHSQNNVEMAVLWLSQRESPETNEGGSTDSIAAKKDESTEEETPDENMNEAGSSKRSRVRDEQEMERQQAEELLEEELGEALQERDMEKDYLGSSLDEEWGFLEKFRADAH